MIFKSQARDDTLEKIGSGLALTLIGICLLCAGKTTLLRGIARFVADRCRLA